jgi:hypothetical protein
MAYQGEYFVARYGVEAARHSPPINAMLKAWLPVGGGTDATRVASYNPWICLYWLTTGKTVGGLKLYDDENLLDRETALKLWTINNTWFSNEENTKGYLKAGLLADFVVLSDDYFSITDEDIKNVTSVLTVVDGKIVYADKEFKSHAPIDLQVMPDWSPVNYYGGYQAHSSQYHFQNLSTVTKRCCYLHPEPKTKRSTLEEALADWSLGCGCWAF